MRYTEYVGWFEGERGKLILESGCTQVGPLWRPTPTSRPPWQVKWCVKFGDGKHLRVKESWAPRPVRLGGLGYRRHFSFHYGDTNPLAEMDGFPVRDNAYATTIRIDEDPYGPHLNYDGRNHIFQPKVQGFDIARADLFEFVKAVHLHRKTGTPFHEILKFTVLP